MAKVYGMELTAKTIREVTFGAKVRGYDPAEVDEFIAAVADGVDELQERLRRATDRANRAEQAGTIDAPVAAAVSQPSTTGEISKVWERAVAAAEEAIAEAKQSAQELLQDAQQQAAAQVGTARDEAVRVSNEAQAGLREEIAKLEAARDQLKIDVGHLSGYLDTEREKVRAVLNRALDALNDDETGAAPPPSVPSVSVPEQVSPLDAIYESPTAGSWQAGSLIEAPQPPAQRQDAPQMEAPQPAWQQQEWPDTSAEPEAAPEASDWQAAEPQPQMPEWQPTPAAEQPDWRTQPESSDADGDGDQDPFLAELRRAVQDDGPLGPRDEPTDDDGNPMADLYANDDDDKSGFFRRKK